MPASRIARRRSATRPTSTVLADATFPRAVRGEDYARYASATWGQAVRWLRGVASVTAQISATDVYTALRATAAASVARDLYPQEEQLLGELMQREWEGIIDAYAASTPEIPSFLRPPK